MDGKNQIVYLSTGNLRPILKVELINIHEDKARIKVLDPPSRIGEELIVKSKDLIYTENS